MKTFRILSLDGGGIRGAFSAAFLAEIEKELDIRVADCFDLIAGTSTGGIIAIGLALGVPAEQIVGFYEAKGARVFQKQPPVRSKLIAGLAAMLSDGVRLKVGGAAGFALGLITPILRFGFNRLFRPGGFEFDMLLRTRYESKQLELALRDVYGNKSLGEAITRIIIPAVDLTCGKPVVFKSPHLPDACSRDKAFSAVEIAMATAAAPTYFPHATIRDGSAYCDGGLWANNPVLLAVAEAERVFTSVNAPERFGDTARRNPQVLSIGTGKSPFSLVPPESRAGLFWWGPRILDVMSLTQAAGIHGTAQFMLGDGLCRVDFDLPNPSWKLDSVEHTRQLIHIGREKAHENLAHVRSLFVKQESPMVALTA